MINISNKKDCCGCAACVQRCPKQCISIKEDDEGFLYPIVYSDDCINCGLCEKVCPVLNQAETRKPLKVYAVKNKIEEIRKQSSSGGIFTFLAEEVIKEGGVVFGARFDEHFEVKHDFTETIEGLGAFRGSKYVQSRIEDNYQKVEVLLKDGKKVLFSGTPCQIAGLKCFLRKEYDNLLTVDFICHGVPSPGVWRKYLKETIARLCDKKLKNTFKENILIESISFRNKCLGWKKYNFVMTVSATAQNGAKVTFSLRELFSSNTFMNGFLSNLYLRPSCYSCPSKCCKSGSDITLGDLWGASSIIGPEDDDKGTSLVMINNDSINLNDCSSLWLKEIDYNAALVYNPAIENSVKLNHKRELFYLSFSNNSGISKIINKLTRVSIFIKFINFMKRVFKHIIKFL